MSIFKSLRWPILFAVLIWLIEFADAVFRLDLEHYGVFPRRLEGAWGILLSPLLHDDWAHLISNTIPLLVLSAGIALFYPALVWRIWSFIYVVSGMLVWFFARSSYHVGASSLIYGFAAFLFASGLFRNDFKAVGIAAAVAMLYGGMIAGVFPTQPNMSWEGHLFGGVAGVAIAYLLRKKNSGLQEPHEQSVYPNIDHREGYTNIENKKFKYNFKQK